MTTTQASNFTISHTVDQGIIDELESSFDGYRSRIALLSMTACGSLTSMFGLTEQTLVALVPVEAEVIDIEAIEATVAPRELVAAERIAPVRELVAA